MKVRTFGTRHATVLTAALVAFAAFAVPSAGAQGVPVPDVFNTGIPSLLSAPTAARSAEDAATSRSVEVDASVLVPDTAVAIEVDVFSDARFTVDLEPFDGGTPGWDAWTGPIRDVDDGSATFIRRGDVVSGVVSTPDGTFRVQRRGTGHVARKAADLSARQSNMDYLIPPADEGDEAKNSDRPSPGEAPHIGEAPAAGSPGRVVDVLVAYTPRARIEMGGGMAAIEDEATMSVAVTNAAYVTSGVDGSLRLVGLMETSTNVTLGNGHGDVGDDFDAGLTAASDPSDGIVDEVAVRRDALGADLVAVLTGTDTKLCGLGWFLINMAGDSAFGYSLTAWDCAVDDLAFAHELGHNMGLDHDRYVATEPAPFLPYARGYVNVAAGWRTIMAYDSACSVAGKTCTGLPRFSNPDQTYGGQPLGRPEGSPDAADSRKALNRTIPVVAGYRIANDTPKLGFQPIVPCRIVDTRSRGGRLTNGASRTFQVAGSGTTFAAQGGKPGGCNIPANANAVEATITAVDPGAGGFSRAYPAGTAMPGATFLNYVRGQSIGNTGTIPIATSGSTADLTVSNYGGTAHYVIDIQGYFSQSAALGYASIVPCRVVDTRSKGASLTNGATRTFQVAGSGTTFVAQGGHRGGCNIPANANAVEATITAVGPGAGGFARVYPAGTAMPGATFLNYVRGQSIGNTGTIPIATSGSTADLTVSNYGGTTHYVIDIQGYFSPTAPLRYVSLTPCRVVDSRYSVSWFVPDETRTYQVAGSGPGIWDQGGASDGCRIPPSAKAVEATVTAVGPYVGGFARAYPADTATAGATFLNYVAGQSIGNTGTIPIATSGSRADLVVKNYGGYTDYVIDVQGFYSPA